MNTILDIVYYLIIVQVAVGLHELAHYWAARAQGVKVNSFSIGMGPVLWRRPWRGTEWRLSLLPIGGYVEIDGMVPDTLANGQMAAPTHGFARLGSWGKVGIMLAGPAMNLLLALVFLTLTFSVQGVTDTFPQRARIESVLPNSTAQQLGLRPGDVITRIDGQAMPQQYTVDGVSQGGYLKLQDALGQDGHHSVTFIRAGATRTVSFDWTVMKNGVRQRLGVGYGPDMRQRKVSVGTAAALSVSTATTALPQVLHGFASIFGRLLTLDVHGDGQVVGPVGTVQVIGQAAKGGFWDLLGVAAALNLSLAYLNLLPIPGLDGGRVLLTVLQAIRRRPFEPAQEGVVNFAGLAVVMLVMLFVVVSDVVRLF